jgi:hypothetical protein
MMIIYRRLDRYPTRRGVAQPLTSTLRTPDTLNVPKIRSIMTDINVLALTVRHYVIIGRVVHSPPPSPAARSVSHEPQERVAPWGSCCADAAFTPVTGTCVSRKLLKRSSRVERRISENGIRANIDRSQLLLTPSFLSL